VPGLASADIKPTSAGAGASGGYDQPLRREPSIDVDHAAPSAVRPTRWEVLHSGADVA
jgi:hypothetical protein